MFRYGQISPSNQTLIKLEKCTLDHFPYLEIDDFQTDFNLIRPKKINPDYQAAIKEANLVLSKWTCLPLNKSYQMGKTDRNSILN